MIKSVFKGNPIPKVEATVPICRQYCCCGCPEADLQASGDNSGTAYTLALAK